MSHFTVAVFHDEFADLDAILEPYCECTENPEYQEFEVVRSGKELHEEWKEERPEIATIEEYAEYCGYEYDPELDAVGYMHNPNSRWDWFQIGGRWSGLLKLKPGCEGVHGSRSWCNSDEEDEPGTCDSVRLCDVDLSLDQEAYDEAIRFWEIYVEKRPLNEGEKAPLNFWKPEYYIDQFGTKENYARQQAEFSTYAFVTPDGEWHETGTMGWWGMDNATAESRKEYRTNLAKIIEELKDNPDIWITIVDCHI